MCGIMGYIGTRPAAPILLEGLRRLEYRGYDSAGIALAGEGTLTVQKAAGKLGNLEALIADHPGEETVGIGHTRWATHGRPTDTNAHPHADPSGEFVVVHNGIIENFYDLRQDLTAAGHVFVSETDTEVLAHLIADAYDGDLAAAVRSAVDRARGAYALVAMTSREPRKIVAVRMISPMVVGFGKGEMFLASDIPALLPYTDEVLIVEDGEIVMLDESGARLETLAGEAVERSSRTVEWGAAQAERGGYPHFMLKEIFEQPTAIRETMLGRVEASGRVDLDGADIAQGDGRGVDRIWITACGTAYHAGLLGKAVIENLARIPVDVAYAHELRYADPLIDERSLAIAISQSGETVDTLVAARLAAERGARVLAVTNVVGSSLSRLAGDVLYTRAGPEIAVASTKAYATQLVAMYLIGLALGRARGCVDDESAERLAGRLLTLPDVLAGALKREAEIEAIAGLFGSVEDAYFIGRGLDYPVAMEGSLKLKEISYIHSEAMPAGELKHGTLALITDGTPVVALVTQGSVYDKTISAVQEVKARGALVIAVAYDDDADIGHYADHVLRIPRVDDLLAPVAAAVPLQLLAYHVARERGHDIDQPRNLAKSVTVE